MSDGHDRAMSEPVQPPPEWAAPPPGFEWTEPTDLTEPRSPGFLRRNWLTVSACAVAVVSLSIAIGMLATASGGSTPAEAGPVTAAAPSAPAASTAPARPGAANRAIRATIVSEVGSAWTVRTANGATVNVSITAQTQFGRPKLAADAAQFPVGSQVIITGTLANGSATAIRVIAPKSAAATSPSPAQS
jgi:hypothetical protein